MRPLKIDRRGFLLQGLTFLSIAKIAPAKADADQAVTNPVKQLIATLLTVMKLGPNAPFEQRVSALAPAIDQAFDLQTILRESIGPSWATIPASQQADLLAAFRRYTIASYVHSFDSFNGQQFQVQPDTRPMVNGEQVVQTQIIRPNGETHPLDYVMRQTEGAWRVVDVLAEGTVSRVAVQRSDFRRLLSRGGGEALVASLQAKTKDLAS